MIGANANDVSGQVQPPSRVRLLMQRLWWLHSLGALAAGITVMAFARHGLAYADKILIVLGLAWGLVFVAFRFIVGPTNRSPDERLLKRGVRVVTNYVVKQLYQQMFFFLVPLYASSATWSFHSYNWWIVPVLLACAVVSTMDLVFDNVVMEHRSLAGAMYGLCMFSVLNLLLPLVLHVPHLVALLVAAGVTPPAVAFLSYSTRTVLSVRGITITVSFSAALMAGCYYGRAGFPPAPTAMSEGGIGHGAPGAYECVPGPVKNIPLDRTDHIRCVSEVVEPGGLHDEIVHVWLHNGQKVARIVPEQMPQCTAGVFKSILPTQASEPGPGRWVCRVETADGQFLGRLTAVILEDEEAP